MLKIENISKTFNPGTIHQKVALSNLSLQLEEGDFVTVIGSNGAGKSTMLNAISGSWFVDEGDVIDTEAWRRGSTAGARPRPRSAVLRRAR